MLAVTELQRRIDQRRFVEVMVWMYIVGTRRSRKSCGSHIGAAQPRQPLVKGERLVRYEVSAVMVQAASGATSPSECLQDTLLQQLFHFVQLALQLCIGWIYIFIMLPRRVCSPQRCAMPVLHVRVPEQARGNTSPCKN